MATRNSLSDYEVSIIKALIATKEYSNQEIAGIINRSRGSASLDISTGRISNIKNNEIKKYSVVASASFAELECFLNLHKSTDPEPEAPLSKSALAAIIRTKAGFPNFLDITETDRIECKKSVNVPMKTLAAFANNKGGYLVFGVINGTWEIVGIDEKKYSEFDFNKLNQNILSTLGIGLEIQKCTVIANNKCIGIMHVAPAHTKPVIMTRDGDGFSQGCIYYRYPGEDRLITSSDLQNIIEQRIKNLSETILTKHLSNIMKFGISNSAILDLNTGIVDGKAGNFIIESNLLKSLSFIKDGEFVEKSGAPALKLIGEVSPANVVTKLQKLTDAYPYSYRDLFQKLKSMNKFVNNTIVQKIIKEKGLKDKTDYASYNFRNKLQEEEFRAKKKIPKTTPVIYNDKAIEYINKVFCDEYITNAVFSQ